MSNSKLIAAMIEYYVGDPRRINHFLKVFALAKSIGENEGLSKEAQEVVDTASIVHDIGIKVAEEKYNSSSGKYQEIEGPALAEALLTKLGYKSSLIQEVCYLVGHHHTYNKIDSPAYQILVEADFLVNIDEDQLSIDQIKRIKEKIFRTNYGMKFLTEMYLL